MVWDLVCHIKGSIYAMDVSKQAGEEERGTGVWENLHGEKCYDL
jgi:hypothetical protein